MNYIRLALGRITIDSVALIVLLLPPPMAPLMCNCASYTTVHQLSTHKNIYLFCLYSSYSQSIYCHVLAYNNGNVELCRCFKKGKGVDPFTYVYNSSNERLRPAHSSHWLEAKL